MLPEMHKYGYMDQKNTLSHMERLCQSPAHTPLLPSIYSEDTKKHIMLKVNMETFHNIAQI